MRCLNMMKGFICDSFYDLFRFHSYVLDARYFLKVNGNDYAIGGPEVVELHNKF
jgi:hypothetical protein